jgi:hypothetical protein
MDRKYEIVIELFQDKRPVERFVLAPMTAEAFLNLEGVALKLELLEAFEFMKGSIRADVRNQEGK